MQACSSPETLRCYDISKTSQASALLLVMKSSKCSSPSGPRFSGRHKSIPKCAVSEAWYSYHKSLPEKTKHIANQQYQQNRAEAYASATTCAPPPIAVVSTTTSEDKH